MESVHRRERYEPETVRLVWLSTTLLA